MEGDFKPWCGCQMSGQSILESTDAQTSLGFTENCLKKRKYLLVPNKLAVNCILAPSQNMNILTIQVVLWA